MRIRRRYTAHLRVALCCHVFLGCLTERCILENAFTPTHPNAQVSLEMERDRMLTITFIAGYHNVVDIARSTQKCNIAYLLGGIQPHVVRGHAVCIKTARRRRAQPFSSHNIRVAEHPRQEESTLSVTCTYRHYTRRLGLRQWNHRRGLCLRATWVI